MTPNFAVIGIETPHWHTPRLWLPLFLLWIPVTLLSPLIFLVMVAMAIACRMTIWRIIAIFTRTTIWRLIALCWGIVSALPGTDVRVTAEGTHVLVRVL